jgi:hypothetical protein
VLTVSVLVVAYDHLRCARGSVDFKAYPYIFFYLTCFASMLNIQVFLNLCK